MQNNINYKPNSQKVPSAPFAVDPSPTLDSGNNWSIFFSYTFASPQMVKHLPTMRETWVQSLGREDLLEKEMATHSSTLAWKIPWMEEPGRLQSMGSQRVRHDFTFTFTLPYPWRYLPKSKFQHMSSPWDISSHELELRWLFLLLNKRYLISKYKTWKEKTLRNKNTFLSQLSTNLTEI